MLKLNGQPGRYPANEGLAIRKMTEAAAAALGPA
jgi:hypothetical protein